MVPAAFEGVGNDAKEAVFDCPKRRNRENREGLNRALARRAKRAMARPHYRFLTKLVINGRGAGCQTVPVHSSAIPFSSKRAAIPTDLKAAT